MILAAFVATALLAASLLVPVAVDRSVPWPPPERGTDAARRAEGRRGAAAGVVGDRMHRAHGFGRSALSGAQSSAEFNDLIVEFGAVLRRRPSLHDRRL